MRFCRAVIEISNGTNTRRFSRWFVSSADAKRFAKDAMRPKADGEDEGVTIARAELGLQKGESIEFGRVDRVSIRTTKENILAMLNRERLQGAVEVAWRSMRPETDANASIEL